MSLLIASKDACIFKFEVHFQRLILVRTGAVQMNELVVSAFHVGYLLRQMNIHASNNLMVYFVDAA